MAKHHPSTWFLTADADAELQTSFLLAAEVTVKRAVLLGRALADNCGVEEARHLNVKRCSVMQAADAA